VLALAGCGTSPPQPAALTRYDLLIRNGLVYDGSGTPPRRVDIGVRGDRVAALLPAGSPAEAAQVLDAKGQAVAPGFINVLSWATESLIADGRGMSDTKQGVTLEVFGEGWSMGPLNPAMKAEMLRQAGRHPVSDRMDHPRQLPGLPAAARHHAQHRLVRRCDHGADTGTG
jgi:N-acyl-D-amino-acid deacylase